MADDPDAWTSETQIPVRGDCGHIFTAPIGRVEDGGEFTCPVCGAVDRFDDEARKDAHRQIEKLQEQNTLDPFALRLGEYLRKEEADVAKDGAKDD